MKTTELAKHLMALVVCALAIFTGGCETQHSPTSPSATIAERTETVHSRPPEAGQNIPGPTDLTGLHGTSARHYDTPTGQNPTIEDKTGTGNGAAPGASKTPPGPTGVSGLHVRSAPYYTGALNADTVCKPQTHGGDGVPVHSRLRIDSATARRVINSTNIEVDVSYTGDLTLRGYCIRLIGIDPDQGYQNVPRWSFHSTSSNTRTIRVPEISQWQHGVSARAVITHSHGGNTFLFRTQSRGNGVPGRTW